MRRIWCHSAHIDRFKMWKIIQISAFIDQVLFDVCHMAWVTSPNDVKAYFWSSGHENSEESITFWFLSPHAMICTYLVALFVCVFFFLVLEEQCNILQRYEGSISISYELFHVEELRKKYIYLDWASQCRDKSNHLDRPKTYCRRLSHSVHCIFIWNQRSQNVR